MSGSKNFQASLLAMLSLLVGVIFSPYSFPPSDNYANGPFLLVEDAVVLFNYYNNIASPEVLRDYGGYIAIYPQVVAYLSSSLNFVPQIFLYFSLASIFTFFLLIQASSYLCEVGSKGILFWLCVISVGSAWISPLNQFNLMYSMWPAMVGAGILLVRIVAFDSSVSYAYLPVLVVALASHPVSICVLPAIAWGLGCSVLVKFPSNRNLVFLAAGLLGVVISILCIQSGDRNFGPELYRIRNYFTFLASILSDVGNFFIWLQKYLPTVFLIAAGIYILFRGVKMFEKNRNLFRKLHKFCANPSNTIEREFISYLLLFSICITFLVIFLLTHRADVHHGLAVRYGIPAFTYSVLIISKPVGDLFNLLPKMPITLGSRQLLIGVAALFPAFLFFMQQQSEDVRAFLVGPGECVRQQGRGDIAVRSQERWTLLILRERIEKSAIEGENIFSEFGDPVSNNCPEALPKVVRTWIFH